MEDSSERSTALPALHTLTFLLTFCCYGTHLPGDTRGWVDRARGNHRGGLREPSPALERSVRERMIQAPYTLDRHTAQIVLETLRKVCVARGWQLVAAHVRTTHVHCVVNGVAEPNRASGDFKAYASRELNVVEGYRRRWAREGSTRRLSTPAAIQAAVRYVADGQGEPMAVYVWHRGLEGAASPPLRAGL